MTVIHTSSADEAAEASSLQPGPLEAEKDNEPTEDLFPEAKRRARRRRLIVLATLLVVAGLAAGLFALFGGAPPRPPGAVTRPGDGASPAAAAGHFTLRGNGFGTVRFGQAESIAIVDLDGILGAARTKVPQSAAGNCNIDSYLQFSTMTAYFFHGRFVGYDTGSLIGGPQNRKLPNAATAAGMRIGDALAQAQRIYGSALATSGAQGGSWFAKTSTGTLAGYLTNEISHRMPPIPRIADVTAGSVGCPAASP